MVFNNLNVDFNRQSAIRFSRDGFEPLSHWTAFASEALQNQFDTLQTYSSRSVIALIGTINVLFFWGVRSLVNRLEISLVQSYPTVADIRSVTTSALMGITVGALNFGLSRLCRFHLSLLALCTISSSAIAFHLFLKQSIIIRQPSFLPSILRPSRLSPLPPPNRNHVVESGLKANEDPKLQNPSFSRANIARYDLMTPVPLPRPQAITSKSTPIFSPSKCPGQSVKSHPVLNTQDYAQIRGAALIKMEELTKKKKETTALIGQVENGIKSLTEAMNACSRKKSSHRSEMSQISEQIRVKDESLIELKSYLSLIVAESTKQMQILEDIAKRKRIAPENEKASAPDTPEGRRRCQLEIGVKANNISVPPIVSSLLFRESLAQMSSKQTSETLTEVSSLSNSMDDLGNFVFLDDDGLPPIKSLGPDDEDSHLSEEVVDFSEFELVDPDNGLAYLIDEKGFLYVMQEDQRLYLHENGCCVNIASIVLHEG